MKGRYTGVGIDMTQGGYTGVVFHMKGGYTGVGFAMCYLLSVDFHISIISTHDGKAERGG